MSSVTVSTAGESATTTYSVPDALPALPEIAWSSLNPQPGESLDTVLNRMTSNARVVLPAGTYTVVGAGHSGYGVYAPKCLGLRGAGIDKTYIVWAKNSIVNKVTFPASAGTFMRLGPQGGSTGRGQTTLSDMTIQGNPQFAADGVTPMNTSGIINYYGQNSVFQNLKLLGLTYGSGNSPATGETFAINNFHDIGTVIRNVEVDGRDASGTRVMGSPFGCNNSVNIQIYDSNFHDTGWSGVTFSFTSTASTANATNGIELHGVSARQNANHFITKSGARFTCFNHEQVLGTIRYYDPVMEFDHPELWDSSHMSFWNDLIDNQDIEIHNPVWVNSTPKNSGMFTINISGKQATVPKVFNAAGVQMTPIMQHGQPSAALVGDPDTQFVCYN